MGRRWVHTWLGAVAVIAMTATPLSIRADIIDNLYQAKVSTPGQTSRDQRKAVADALAQVLVKVTGAPETLELRAVRSELRRARELLQSFRYDLEQGQLFYVADFDPEKVDGLLRANQLPIWGARRPNSLVWIVEESRETGKRQLLSETEMTPLAPLLRTVASNRAIPVMFPLMDLSERQSVSATDVWGRFTDVVLEASQRYQSEGVLVARLYQPSLNTDISTAQGDEPTQTPVSAPVLLPGQDVQQPWVMDWHYLIDGQHYQGSEQNYQKVKTVSATIDKVADLLASRFAVSRDGSGMLSTAALNISGIREFEDVIAAKRLLAEMAAVASVRLEALHLDKATFKVQLFSDVNHLTQLLALERRISKEKDPFGQDRAELAFRWNGS